MIPIREKCPVCSFPTEIKAGKKDDVTFLYCTNPECPAKHVGRFTRMVDRTALNVTGISKATLQEFLNRGFLKEPADLFSLSKYKKEIVQMDGFGEKSYENIVNAIEAARETTFQRFFYSLGVPGVGKHVAKILDEHFKEELKPGTSKIDQLLGMLCAKDTGLLVLDGIGETNEKAMVDWFLKHRLDFIHLRAELHVQDEFVEEKVDVKKGLQGLTFVITGSVKHYKNRNELKEEIESLGGKVAGSVSKNTSYLINNDIYSNSSKNKTAIKYGVKILSEEDYMKMIRNFTQK